MNALVRRCLALSTTDSKKSRATFPRLRRTKGDGGIRGGGAVTSRKTAPDDGYTRPSTPARRLAGPLAALLLLVAGAGFLLVAGAVLHPAQSAVDLPASTELPNLTALPPSYVEITLSTSPTPPFDGDVQLYLSEPHEPRVLRLTAGAASVGSVALDLLGTPTADPLVLDAQQCVRWRALTCDSRTSVGALRWHAPHRHWHFNDFALYELRRLTPEGAPDMSLAAVMSSSAKASFCLEDTYRHRPGGPPTQMYRGCSGLRQGISPSWADVYDSSLPGQEMPLDGVTDGQYALVVTADPENHLLETDDSDNQAWAVIEITDNVTQARVADQP
jgi:hypothetical protein